MSMYGQFSPQYADNCKLFQKILFRAELHSSFGDWRRGWSFENLLSLLRSNCPAFVKLSNCLTLNGLQRAKFDGEAFQNFRGPCESLTYHSSPGHRTMNRQQDIDHLPPAPTQLDVKLGTTKKKECFIQKSLRTLRIIDSQKTGY